MQPINDARALMTSLKSAGFEVDTAQDATRDDIDRAIGRLKSRIQPGSIVGLFYSGFGVQINRQNYVIPIDAKIWTEADVRRDGISINALLDIINR